MRQIFRMTSIEVYVKVGTCVALSCVSFPITKLYPHKQMDDMEVLWSGSCIIMLITWRQNADDIMLKGTTRVPSIDHTEALRRHETGLEVVSASIEELCYVLDLSCRLVCTF